MVEGGRLMKAQVNSQTKPGASLLVNPNRILQRKCACGQHTVAGGECPSCREGAGSLQRAAVQQSAQASGPLIAGGVPQSSGRSNAPATRAFRGPRPGHDFSSMQVYTVGAEQARRPSPPSLDTRRSAQRPLVNQGGTLQTKLTVGAANDPLEHEANRVARQVMSMPASPTAAAEQASIQRQGPDEDEQAQDETPGGHHHAARPARARRPPGELRARGRFRVATESRRR